jgi:hypothetical protein
MGILSLTPENLQEEEDLFSDSFLPMSIRGGEGFVSFSVGLKESWLRIIVWSIRQL